jgi:hypothetical protein
MQIQLREAKKEDIPQMFNLYKEFSKEFVGATSRGIEDFRRMLRKKDNINWVALNNQNQVIGYIHARLEKRINRGEFEEIIVDLKHDFQQIAKPLVEKVNDIFLEKKVDVIAAGSLRNPAYENIFPALGFFESESMGVFMYTILDTQRFLNELASVFSNRLKKLEERRILAQIECEGHSIVLQKKDGNVEPLVWTNQPIDFKVTLTRGILTKLVFGIADPVESSKAGELRVETTLSQEKTNRLLRALFPKKQFLIMDHW